MKMNSIVKSITVTGGICLLFSVGFSALAASSEVMPNIVLILADDMGAGEPSYAGGLIPTPALDSMAREGMRFTDAHTSSAVCTPTRYGILTGRYNWRSRLKSAVLFNATDRALMDPERLNLSNFLQDAGYHTACIGKWHLGHLPEFLPTSNGFDSYLGIPYSNDMDGVKGKDKNLDRAWRQKDYSPWNVPLIRNEEIIDYNEPIPPTS